MNEDCWYRLRQSIRFQQEAFKRLPSWAPETVIRDYKGQPVGAVGGRFGKYLVDGTGVFNVPRPYGFPRRHSKDPWVPDYWPVRSLSAERGWAAKHGPSPAAYRDEYVQNGKRRLSRKQLEEAQAAYLAKIDPPVTRAEHNARALRLLELHDEKAFTGGDNGEETESGSKGYCDSKRPGALPLAQETWDQLGFEVESLPDPLLIAPNDRELLAAILAKSPGRNVGRPPKKVVAMTDAERAHEDRQRKKEQV